MCILQPTFGDISDINITTMLLVVVTTPSVVDYYYYCLYYTYPSNGLLMCRSGSRPCHVAIARRVVDRIVSEETYASIDVQLDK
jgi:hypothetical protein